MKIVILPEFELTKDKPQCLTCKHRGNASIAYDPTALEGTHRVTGVICNHPDHPGQSVPHDSICEDFDAVHEVLRRLFSMKKIL